MFEGLGAERVPVSDLDPEALQEGGVDGLGGARRARLCRVLSQLARPARLELFLGADLHLVEAADPILGPPGCGLPRLVAVCGMVAVHLHSRLDHFG